MEEEFVSNQERLKPQEDKNEEDRSKVDDLRGSPMSVGSLEELIDENHAIVSSSVGPEYYVGILSFVDKDQLEPGCAILMHNKVSGLLFFQGLGFGNWECDFQTRDFQIMVKTAEIFEKRSIKISELNLRTTYFLFLLQLTIAW